MLAQCFLKEFLILFSKKKKDEVGNFFWAGKTDLFVHIHHLLPRGPGKPVRLGPGPRLGAEVVLRRPASCSRRLLVISRLGRRLFRVLWRRLCLSHVLL